MDKSIVKGFLGKEGDGIIIVSESGKAVAYTGNSNFKVRTELGLSYSGDTICIDCPAVFRGQRAALELSDATEMTFDGESLRIGGVTAEASAMAGTPDFIRLDGKDGGEYTFTEVSRLAHLADCASTDETRYFINGVFFNENGEIASTDARRLCVWRTEHSFPKVLVHREALKLFRKSRSLRMTVRGRAPERNICLTDGKTTVITREINGTFPNYPRVIPSKEGYADAEGFSIDFKKYGDYIKSTGSKNRPAVLQLFNDAVYCRDMQVGSLGFNIDPLVINASYLREAVENVGGKVSWRKVLQDKIGEKIGITEETPYVQRALIFGDLDSYFDVVMPSIPSDDNTAEIFRKRIERISQKSA